MVNRFETYLLPTLHILLPNYNNLKKKTLGQFENLVFVVMSTRDNIRLIARISSPCHVVCLSRNLNVSLRSCQGHALSF